MYYVYTKLYSGDMCKPTLAGKIEPTAVYKLAETAKLLRVDENTIYKEQKEGRLPKRIIGRGYKFTGQEILDFLDVTVSLGEGYVK